MNVIIVNKDKNTQNCNAIEIVQIIIISLNNYMHSLKRGIRFAGVNVHIVNLPKYTMLIRTISV